MKQIRHGLSIGMEKLDNEFYLELKISGKLTLDDYAIITPMLESVLKCI